MSDQEDPTTDRPPITVELYAGQRGEDGYTDFVAAIFMYARPMDGDYIFLPEGYARPGVYRVLRTLWVPQQVWHGDSRVDVSEKRPDHSVARCVVVRDDNVEWFPYREGDNPYKVTV